MYNGERLVINFVRIFSVLSLLCTVSLAQDQMPKPGPPVNINIPKVNEKTLRNKLKVATVERKNVPLVSVILQIDSGQTFDDLESAGTANMAAYLLTKGTRTRTAPQIAEGIEFLGGSIGTEVGMDESRVVMNVPADKIDAAMAIFSDVIINPAFAAKEIELAKTQSLDELSYNLKQPGFLASYVASVFSFYSQPANGTPESIKAMNRKELLEFYRASYLPKHGTLIIVGDISSQRAFTLAQKFFGAWKNPPEKPQGQTLMITEDADSVTERKQAETTKPLVGRILVIDLPNSGQSAVTFNKHSNSAGRISYDDKNRRGQYSEDYFPGLVMNSILGGGYSARLNQEIRIKRGLSYGANSGFTWRAYDTSFTASTQTKDVSAAEVAELVVEEIERMTEKLPEEDEMTPRQAVLTGTFERNLETNEGMSRALAQLYSVWLPPSSLNLYVDKVRAAKREDVRTFARQNLKGGDIIIVGDASKFMDDLKKRFSKMSIRIIKADDLKLGSLATL